MFHKDYVGKSRNSECLVPENSAERLLRNCSPQIDTVVDPGFVLIDGVLSKEGRSMYEILMERMLGRIKVS